MTIKSASAGGLDALLHLLLVTPLDDFRLMHPCLTTSLGRLRPAHVIGLTYR